MESARPRRPTCDGALARALRRACAAVCACSLPKPQTLTASRKREEAAAAAALVASMTHGKPSAAYDPLATAAAALAVNRDASEAQRWRLQQAEQVYASSRVPLGAPVSHGTMPEGLASVVTFGLGKSMPDDPHVAEAKEVLFPSTELSGAPVARLQPGYQTGRERVDWAGAVLSRESVFGAPSLKGAPDSAASAFAQPPPAIGAGAARVAAFHAKRDSTPQPASAGGPAFGVATRADHDAIGAAQLLKGSGLTPEQLVPDARVGHNSRLVEPPPEKTFGTPSRRSDIPPPAMRSIADGKSYGDDAPIATLLSPTPNALTAAAPPMARSEMATFYEACGLALPAHTFDELFARAAAADGLGDRDQARLATVQRLRLEAGL